MKKLEDKRYTHKGYTITKCETGNVFSDNRPYYYTIKKGKDEVRGFHDRVSTLSYATFIIDYYKEEEA